MALEIDLKKISTTQSMRDLYSITINMICSEGEGEEKKEVINQNFSIRYRPGQQVDEVLKKLQVKLQEKINIYKKEQAIFNSTKLDNTIIYLKSNLIG